MSESRPDGTGLQAPTATPEQPAQPAAVAAPRAEPNRPWSWLIIAGPVLAGAAFLMLEHRTAAQSGPGGARSSTKAAPPVSITTVAARKGDIGTYVSALGSVTPLNTVLVRSRVDGQLMSVKYTEGQMVHAGDALVEIDPRPYEAQLAQARGQLARDKALLENAQVDLERYQTAYGKNKRAIPKQQLDTQVAVVHQYQGTVEFDQGQVDTAQLQVTYAHIAAPISGRVGLRLVDAGNIVHATDANALAVITQLQPITVLFSVPEDDLPEIQQQLLLGQKLLVEAYDRGQRKKLATGTLLTLDNQIDTTTGTVRLKALFPNEDSLLFPNQFVNVRLLVSMQHDAILVPVAAIQRNAQGAFVYLVQDEQQTVTMRPVTVGTIDGDLAAVEGLEPGAAIAANNFNRLQDGSKVKLPQPGDEPNGERGGQRRGPGKKPGKTAGSTAAAQ